MHNDASSVMRSTALVGLGWAGLGLSPVVWFLFHAAHASVPRAIPCVPEKNKLAKLCVNFCKTVHRIDYTVLEIAKMVKI